MYKDIEIWGVEGSKKGEIGGSSMKPTFQERLANWKLMVEVLLSFVEVLNAERSHSISREVASRQPCHRQAGRQRRILEL